MPIAEFGAFSLAFAAYLIAVNMIRAFPMQPLAIRYSTVPVDAWRRGTAAALGTVFLVGIVAGVAFVLLGLIVRGAIGPAFVALGLTLPGLLLQDGWRSAFFAGGKGSKAFQNDLVWACTPVSSAGPHRVHREYHGLLADIRVGLRRHVRGHRRGRPIRRPTAAPHGSLVVARAPRSRATFSDRGGR